MWTLRAWSVFVVVFALAVSAIAQSVISTHSGLIYYFDGFVYLDDQQLQPRPGKFPNVPPGAELRTALGRAELLLTPGVFLRLGDKSSIRMLSNDLANTRVELETGSAILDSAEQNSGTAVTLLFKDWQFRSPGAGVLRIDSDPPQVWVLKDKAEVIGPSGQRITLEEGMDLPLAASLTPERSSAEPADGLSDWNKGRSDSIMADNAITQQIDGNPASQTASINGFSNFPFLGLPPVNLTYNSYDYSSSVPAQPGFNSIYLPGYAYPPVILGILVRGASNPAFPPRMGLPGGVSRIPLPRPVGPIPIVGPRVAPSSPVGAPHVPIVPPRPVAPRAPVAGPRPAVHPAPAAHR